VNYDLRSKEISNTAVSFEQNIASTAPIATSRGWVLMLGDDEYVKSGYMDFNYSHQFTLELEVFPLTSIFNFNVIFYENSGGAGTPKLTVNFQNSVTM
jgi:hypothetical protein